VPDLARSMRRSLQCAGKDLSGGWNQSVYNFWIDKPTCAALVVKTRKATRTIHLGIGTPCP
jgi:hypothetical protein